MASKNFIMRKGNMIIRKLRILSISLCILVSTMGTAFAVAEDLIPPDSPVHYDTGEINKEIYIKQVELDRTLFNEYISDLYEKGITVTHTVPTDEYVEIGITPFNEENANFIYDLVGKDKIKIVEGIEAVTLEYAEDLVTDGPATSYVADAGPADSSISDSDTAKEIEEASIVSTDAKEEVSTVSTDENEEVKKSNIPFVLGGITAVLVGALLFGRKRKSA